MAERTKAEPTRRRPAKREPAAAAGAQNGQPLVLTARRGVDNLTLQAYVVVRQAILDNALPGGILLSEYELARTMGFSRTPVREALKRLDHEGLVETVPRRGTFVTRLDVHDIIEIYDIREPLEGSAARIAAEQMSAEVAGLLLAEVIEASRLAQVRDYSMVRDEDIALHKGIIAATSNKRLAQILATLDDQVHRIRAQAVANPQRIELTLAEHQAVIEAIVRRDPGAAEEAMRSHLRAARTYAITIALGGKSLEGTLGA